MKKRNKILAVAFILLFTGAFFGSGVLKSDIPPLLESAYFVVNPDFTMGTCCEPGNFMCICDNCPGQCD